MTADQYREKLKTLAQDALSSTVHVSHNHLVRSNAHDFQISSYVQGADATSPLQTLLSALEALPEPWDVRPCEITRVTGRDPRTGRFTRTHLVVVSVQVDHENL